MKIKTMPVISAQELREEIALQYGVEDVDMASLFWPEDYMNDCYKSLWISEDAIEEDCGDEENVSLRTLIRRHLQDLLPGVEDVLVDVSW